ncbi:MAG: amidohydrolase family protein, partial [Gemmatimonadales bacterium]
MRRFLMSVAVLTSAGVLSAQRPQAADLVVLNAHIYTADANRPVAEALAVRDGRLVFVGSNRGALALAGPRTERLDLASRTVVPGLVDAHAHLLGLGAALRSVNLVGTKTYDEVVARVRERARTARPGEWITGRGW